MIIIDDALQGREKEGRPINVGMVGAGYLGQAIALQIEQYVPGMTLVAISNRTISKAEKAFTDAGVGPIITAETFSEVENGIMEGKKIITEDAELVCRANGIEAIIEVTGEIEFGAKVAMAAIESKKHIILMNAELDATLGPILKVYADKNNVVMTDADGDQPGVMMNLFRFVNSIGYQSVLVGNIKGLQDHYRTPETQKAYAAKFNLTPKMATSFADGTKISMENTVVANATGFKVGQRGMYGPVCQHVNEAVSLFPTEQMLAGGLVDYILGAEPSPGVFVLGYNEEPSRKFYMNHFKMGDGPLYAFYVPYHLPHLEVPLTVARAALFQDAAITPLAEPVCEVITIAKRDLKKGEVLDGIGGFTCYGTIDNYERCRNDGLLPMGLSEGCRLKADIPKDKAIKYSEIDLPAGRYCDKLREEQDRLFNPNS